MDPRLGGGLPLARPGHLALRRHGLGRGLADSVFARGRRHLGANRVALATRLVALAAQLRQPLLHGLETARDVRQSATTLGAAGRGADVLGGVFLPAAVQRTDPEPSVVGDPNFALVGTPADAHQDALDHAGGHAEFRSLGIRAQDLGDGDDRFVALRVAGDKNRVVLRRVEKRAVGHHPCVEQAGGFERRLGRGPHRRRHVVSEVAQLP